MTQTITLFVAGALVALITHSLHVRESSRRERQQRIRGLYRELVSLVAQVDEIARTQRMVRRSDSLPPMKFEDFEPAFDAYKQSHTVVALLRLERDERCHESCVSFAALWLAFSEYRRTVALVESNSPGQHDTYQRWKDYEHMRDTLNEHMQRHLTDLERWQWRFWKRLGRVREGPKGDCPQH